MRITFDYKQKLMHTSQRDLNLRPPARICMCTGKNVRAVRCCLYTSRRVHGCFNHLNKKLFLKMQKLDKIDGKVNESGNHNEVTKKYYKSFRFPETLSDLVLLLSLSLMIHMFFLTIFYLASLCAAKPCHCW